MFSRLISNLNLKVIKKDGIKIRDFKKNQGVVSIISAILLIGLIITVGVTIKTVYIPQWLEQREADHMQIVSSQFTQLKYALDIQTTVETGTAISTYITLGSEEIPFFGLGKTYDSLEILPDSCEIIIKNSTDNYNFSLGTIKFTSSNLYFIDQSFIYEAGSLILRQQNSDTLNGKTYFSVVNFTNISLSIVNISVNEGKIGISGFGTYPIYTEFLNSKEYVLTNLTNITINTKYPNSWKTFFNSSTLKYSGLTYTINETTDKITVDFSGSLGNIFLKVVDINAQIGPGWNE